MLTRSLNGADLDTRARHAGSGRGRARRRRSARSHRLDGARQFHLAEPALAAQRGPRRVPAQRDGDLRVRQPERRVLHAMAAAWRDADAPLPVVIVQHGLGRERSDALPMANALAGLGYATIAIDAPFHGSSAGTGDDATIASPARRRRTASAISPATSSARRRPSAI